MSKLTGPQARVRRHRRVRKKIVGSTERPRLAVFRSLQHIYVQVIDDSVGQTLAAASTLDPEIRDSLKDKTKSQEAAAVGALIGKRAQAAGVKQVVFDRGGFLFHGRVAELAKAARENGLEF